MAVNSNTATGASIDGMNFVVDPQSVSWDYSVKIGTQPTIGGKVVQLLGFNMGDLIVRGQYPARSTMWNQRKFFERMVDIADSQVPKIGKPSPKPVRFMWPDRNWDFWVYLRALKQDGADVSIERNEAMFSPTYTLTMFVYEDNGNIIKAIQGSAQVKFLQRITAGMGWTQTDWNGPMTIADVSATLAGSTVWEYLATPLPFSDLLDQGADPFSTEEEAN
jgi:hypothetical protein